MLVSHVRERVFSAFSDLHFEEKRHLYTLDGRPLISVSKLVEKHAEKVDFEKILPFSAKKKTREEGRLVTAFELRDTWKKKNKDACDLGHSVHDFMESYNGSQKPRNGHEAAGVKFFNEMSDDYDVLFREIRMFSREFHYAGTEDLILIHRSTGRLITADYKTNGDLWKSFKEKPLLPPFDYLVENPYNKYQLQLSYYQIMLEEVGLEVDDRWLVYLKPDGTYQVFSLINLVEDLKDHLKNRIAA